MSVFLGALLVLAATSLGSAAAFLLNRFGKGLHSALLAFSAGVMAFSAMEMLFESRAFSGDAATLAFFAFGVLAFFAVERVLPHLHLGFRASPQKRSALVAGAVTLHNVPEGFAIAAAFASSPALGWTVASSMALQDAPEGLAVSASVSRDGRITQRCVQMGFLSGLVEAVSAVVGYALLASAAAFIPPALAFSSGAMLFVVLAELLPEAFSLGSARRAALSFAAGLCCAFALASLFGLRG